MNNSFVFKSLSLLVFVLLFAACEKDQIKSEVAPELPPESSFIVDFQSFVDGKGKTAVTQSSTNLNFFIASTNVAIWQTVIAVGMVIPSAVFLHSFKHNPEYLGQNTWSWDYSFPVSGVTHSAKLTGEVIGTEVEWKMYVSKNGAFTDYLWYTGRSKTDGTSGYWVLNDNPTKKGELFRIEWTNDQKGEQSIRFENLTAGAENGSFIQYKKTNDSNYDSFFDYYLKSQKTSMEIEWNSSSRDGRVKSQKAFKNLDWQCWNKALVDIDC